MEYPVVGIVIPVRNRAGEMKRLLESVKKQEYPLDKIRVAVVDAVSTDGTPETCKAFEFVTFISLPAERHISRNVGARAIESKYLIHIDSDMELVPNTVAALVKIAEEERFDFLSIPERSTGDTLWAKARAIEKIVIDDDPDRCGARFMSRACFEAVGGYDEHILHSEDYNIHTRLKKAGFKHRVAKETFLYHHEGCSLIQAAKKQFYYSQSAHHYIRKFPEASMKQYNPFRAAYLKHAGLLLKHPFLTFSLFAGKALTYFFGLFGMIYGIFKESWNSEKTDDGKAKMEK